MDKITKETVDNLAKKYLGQKKFNRTSFDCFDFMVLWYKEFGIDVPDYLHRKYWNGVKVDISEYYKNWDPVREEDLQINDVVLTYAVVREKDFLHIGIYIGDGKFIQLMENEGVVISRVAPYRRIILGFYRFKNNGSGQIG